jgi:guanine deaminase
MEGRAEFMQQAIALATENVTSGRGGPFGAVIVKDGKVIAAGANQVTATNDPTAHAEVTAIRAACQALEAFAGGLRGLHELRALPDVPGGDLLGAVPAIYYGCNAADAAKAGFDDAFLYDEMKKPLGSERCRL